MVSFPNCKINLGLRILNKRPDGFHDLETIFLPIPLHDGLEIIQNPSSLIQEPVFTSSGIPLNIKPEENICVKAYFLLKNDFPQLPGIIMHLHKVIPHGAGLGGGSADGAFSLLLLNRRFNLGLTREQLMHYAQKLGSDCPFFILNQPCLGSGRGETLEPLTLDLSSYKIAIVNPGIQINTGWAFSKITPNPIDHSLKEIIQQPVPHWKNLLVNDFEKIVFQEFPEIRMIKDLLYQNGALFAGMSGSGSTVYGIFEKDRPLNLSLPTHYFQKEYVL